MKCCEKCFEDHLLVEWIRSYGKKGTCDVCGATKIHTVEASALNEEFQGLVNLYEPVESGTHFDHECGPEAIDISDTLPACIENDGWGVFSERLTDEQQCDLLDEIRRVSHHHDSCDTSSGDLWTSPDKRLWHMSEEDMWHEFCHHIKHTRRFLLKEDSVNAVSDPKDWLPTFLPSVERTIKEGKVLYRGRRNAAGENDKAYDAADMGAPPDDKAIAGRANPCGIVVLYAAVERETAIAEMRASVGARVTVARLRAKRKLVVADLASMPYITSAFTPLPSGDYSLPELVSQNRFLRCVNTALSKPVQPEEKEIEYVPTQYVAEVVKNEKYDGIIYRSSLAKDGHNIVLFDPEAVEVEPPTELLEITSVACKFQPVK